MSRSLTRALCVEIMINDGIMCRDYDLLNEGIMCRDYELLEGIMCPDYGKLNENNMCLYELLH